MFGLKRKYREDHRQKYLKNFMYGLAYLCDEINFIEEFKKKHSVSFSSKGMSNEQLKQLSYEIKETARRAAIISGEGRFYPLQGFR